MVLILDVTQDRGVVIEQVVDVMRTRIGRDHDRGDTRTIGDVVEVGWRHVIVEAPKVVPGHEDYRAAPSRAPHQRVELLYRPVLANTDTVRWVVALFLVVHQPDHSWKPVCLDVLNEGGIRLHVRFPE